MLLPASGQAAGDFAPIAPQGSGTVSAESPAGEAATGHGASNYIVGGKETTFNRHPWLVQITLNGSAHCGGALVHPMLVLTAAHCLYSAQNGAFWDQLGVLQAFTSRTFSETGGEQLLIQARGIPSNYQPLDGGLSGENDWGLIALSSPSSRPTLKIAGPKERSIWKTGKKALIAGFGNIAQGGAPSPVLKEVTVPLISDAFCGSNKSYGTSFRPANMLCAGINKGGIGTCQGDSGGPLTVPIDGGGRRIVGLVSWADGCAKPNKPTVYARVGEPGVSAQINELAAEAGQTLNFPGSYADTNIVGSGARPAGCSAARKQANTAKKQADKAAKAARKAKGAVNKARKRVRKARGKAKAKAQRALTRANRQLQSASKKARTANKNSAAAAKKAKRAC